MSKMSRRIAIDASRTTITKPTGTEYYALRLLQTLIRANEGRPEPFQFTLYFRGTPREGLFERSPNSRQVVIPFPRMWTHIRLAAALCQARHEVTFVPAHTLPFLFPGSGIVTVHDLGFKHFPDAHPAWQRKYLDATTRYSQGRASLVLADSQATADDLGRFYGTDPGKIRIVYPGVDVQISQATAEHIEATRAKFQLPQRYFLFIGTLQPRKNIERIVQAFDLWRKEQNDQETALVLAGGKGWLFDPNWIEGVPNLVLTGYIDEADKMGLLGGAIALVFPSLHEGFGFPALEAMISGAPVIASNTSSLPELVGDAGLQVDPLDVREIAAAISRCSDDKDLRRDLVERGYRRAKRFTWEAAAERVLDALEELYWQR